ncbi:MAG: PEFG-CTERM sorting domain-containing protein [Nitrosopumilaceae archaeon]|nr:PEFG-CTERM sorting domain-containing protein [Nitrosopumilaceae archaeon]
MNLKRSLTTITLILLAFSIVSVSGLQSEASAQTQGMSITATAKKGSDAITVTGHTVSAITDVTFRVTSPNGNVVSVGQVTPDSMGDFETQFKIGPTWKENGLYTITAMQSVTQNSLYTLKVRVGIVNGMTEAISVTSSNLEKGIIKDTAVTNQGLSVFADFEIGSNEIAITGVTDKISTDVTLTVKAPNGNVVSVNQISPKMNGEFEATITTGGPLWKQDGFYSVTAQQGTDTRYKDSVEVEILNGVVVPEFGTIAALILAVAIISIVAVSAKSRLSIIPRY